MIDITEEVREHTRLRDDVEVIWDEVRFKLLVFIDNDLELFENYDKQPSQKTLVDNAVRLVKTLP